MASLVKPVSDLRRVGNRRGRSENVAFELRQLGDVEKEAVQGLEYGGDWSRG